MKILVESKGKLLKEYGEAVNAKDFDQEKCDKLFRAIEQKEAAIKLVEKKNEKIAGGNVAKHEIRSLETGKVLPAARDGDLEEWTSDVMKVISVRGGVQSRDLLESSTSGQFVVPEVLSRDLISYITERSLLGRLKVPTVTTTTDTTTIAQVSALPTTSVVAEGEELTETDVEFTPHTLQMYSYRSGVICSQEWMDDSIANPQNVLEPLAQSIASKLDDTFVNGSGSGEPLGLDVMTGTGVRYWMGADGAVITDYSPVELLWRRLNEKNINVDALVMAYRTLGSFRLLATATELMPMPSFFPELPMVPSNKVSITQEEGSSGTVCSSIYASEFAKTVLSGWRYGAGSLKFISDPYTLANYGKVRIYAYLRHGLAYPYGNSVFGKIIGIIPGTASLT